MYRLTFINNPEDDSQISIINSTNTSHDEKYGFEEMQMKLKSKESIIKRDKEKIVELNKVIKKLQKEKN